MIGKRIVQVVYTALLTALAACGGGGGGAPAAPLPPLPPPPPPPSGTYSDVTPSSGIAYAVGFTPPPFPVVSAIAESTHGGAAVGDCDGDGDIDLFITYGDSGPNRLYMNQLADTGSALRFVDNAFAAGVANSRLPPLSPGNDRHSGPIFADMDGDGDLDLFVGGLYRDPVKIYENAGDCTFTDVTENSPEIDNIIAEQTLMAAFGDYDLDGDLDMFMTHYGTLDASYMPGFSEHLWENVSDASGIRFVNASVASNVTDLLWETRSFLGPSAGAPQIQEMDHTFTPAFALMNNDPWPDIVIAGDGSTSQLLLSNGDGTFYDADTSERILTNAQFGMGSALGDYDDDGDLDWFITSIHGEGDPSLILGNRLYRNDALVGADMELADVTDTLDVSAGGWGWGACFLDIDNDTDLDIYHTNGWPHAYFDNFYVDDRSVVFVKQGQNYTDETASFGLDDTYSGRGVVCADFDEDGDIDLLQLTDEQPNSGVLWENRTAAAGNNYLRVKLDGLAPNTGAAGARIYVTIGGQMQMREVIVGGNYIGQHPTVQHFGLGSATVIDEVRVEWPARLPGPTQPADWVELAVAANQTLEIVQQP